MLRARTDKTDRRLGRENFAPLANGTTKTAKRRSSAVTDLNNTDPLGYILSAISRSDYSGCSRSRLDQQPHRRSEPKTVRTRDAGGPGYPTLPAVPPIRAVRPQTAYTHVDTDIIGEPNNKSRVPAVPGLPVLLTASSKLAAGAAC